jgi:hypothetical protein
LPDGCPICRVPRGSDILYTDENDVTAAKLAIDCLIEQSEVASAAFDLELRPDQTCLGRSGGFTPVSFPLFHGTRFAASVVFTFILHGHTPRLCSRDEKHGCAS